LYDIAGQEQWANMRHKYYKGSHAAFVVGDVSREITFEKIKTFWIKDLKEFCPKIPLILIANKDDLNLNIDKKEIERIRNYINAVYLLFTSAKTGSNVNKAFQLISELIMKKN
jgi:small GTP-binding protein